MARGAQVRIEGLAELGRNFRTVSKEVKEKGIRKAAAVAARVVVKRAKAIVTAKGLIGDEPIHMRDAIRNRRLSKVSKNGLEVQAVGVFKIGTHAKTGKKYTYAKNRKNKSKGRAGKNYQVDPPEFYWKFIELGTVKMTPKPFLVPAFDAEKSDSPYHMGLSLEKDLKATVAKLPKTKKKGAAV